MHRQIDIIYFHLLTNDIHVNKKIKLLLFCSISALLFGCKKKDTSPPQPQTSVTPGAVLSSEANVVIIPTYVTLADQAAVLYNQALAFQSAPTQQNLVNCRQAWLNASASYEQSSATLFGPNGSLGADPASLINTYPIDTEGINQVVNTNTPAAFTLNFIDSLPSFLTGFHGMEFELYGISGNKAATEFSPSQLAYITAVALNIKTFTWQLDSEWSAANQGSYYYQFVNAGNGSSVYFSQQAAFNDMVMAIANITETCYNYKLSGILYNKSTILQESPFANNSIADIENNLLGVQEIYLGQYNGVQGTGLSNFVKQNAVNLDIKIKTDLATAQKNVSLITAPLAQAIYTQTSQINAAITACDSLNDDLKVSLLTYINANTPN